MLLERCFAERADGFFIDVGAWHPVLDSVTYHFSQKGWSGINVEPSPQYYELLERARPRDINLQLVVGESEGTVRFTVVAGSQLSTAKPMDEGFRRDLAQDGFLSSEIDLPMRTLAAVCAEHVPADVEIDFLKIDVEGFEERVIRGADWQSYRPRILIMEALQQVGVDVNTDAPITEDSSSQWEPFILDQGYIAAGTTGVNRFYVRTEDEQLANVLSTPANVLDGFVSYDLILAREEAAALRADVEQINAEHEALEKSIGTLEEQVTQILSSTSWRATAPLRALSRLVRRQWC